MDLSDALAVDVWLVLAFFAGRFAWAKSGRAAIGWAIGILVACAPYWHLPKAWGQYSDAVNRDGGVDYGPGLTIDSVYVAGARPVPDMFQRCVIAGEMCSNAFDLRVAATEIDDFTATGERRGVVRFSLAQAGDPRCAELAMVNSQPGKHDFWTLPEGRCFAIDRLEARTSRFEYREEASTPSTSRWWPLSRRAYALIDRATGRTVASGRAYFSHVEPLWRALPDITLRTGNHNFSIEDLRRGNPRD